MALIDVLKSVGAVSIDNETIEASRDSFRNGRLFEITKSLTGLIGLAGIVKFRLRNRTV